MQKPFPGEEEGNGRCICEK